MTSVAVADVVMVRCFLVSIGCYACSKDMCVDDKHCAIDMAECDIDDCDIKVRPLSSRHFFFCCIISFHVCPSHACRVSTAVRYMLVGKAKPPMVSIYSARVPFLFFVVAVVMCSFLLYLFRVAPSLVSCC